MKVRVLRPFYRPFAGVARAQREREALFTRVFGAEHQAGDSRPAGSIPRVESYREGNTLHLKADPPGPDPQEVEVTVVGNRLTLQGERQAQQEGKDGQVFRREVRYGTFSRTFTLPEGVQADAVQARYHNGVLEVTSPLPAAQAAKRIPIAGASAAPQQLAA